MKGALLIECFSVVLQSELGNIFLSLFFNFHINLLPLEMWMRLANTHHDTAHIVLFLYQNTQ